MGDGEEESVLTSSPVIRPAEPRAPSYTGPLYADREGGSLPTERSLREGSLQQRALRSGGSRVHRAAMPKWQFPH
jgi:hypothetical protein